MVNFGLLIGVIGFVVKSPTVVRSSSSSLVSSEQLEASGPLDQISSADIAVNVARLTQLPETTSVINHADSFNAELTALQADNSIVAKPQVMSSALPSHLDIQTYVTKTGDTVDSVAEDHGVSSASVRWSNNLTGNNLAPGDTLYMPPAGVNGIVYKVKSGDTPTSLASRFSANERLIIAYNDAEIRGLKPGKRIIIPNGSIIQSQPRPVFLAWSGGGGYYDRGWCTDWASRRGGAPGGWGNANTWDNYAPLSGWTVSRTPRVGAIAQTDAGWAGHVGVVEAVSEDGTMIKYSDMNGLAGFNRVGYSDWVPTHAKYQRFIYR